mmetsp:Transcript_30445/g.88831  ORF Transcript_30445/g.88831 Transcript_30445/m.88831 type:complete len:368 (+) Transcript_30445:2376-3479(+)
MRAPAQLRLALPLLDLHVARLKVLRAAAARDALTRAARLHQARHRRGEHAPPDRVRGRRLRRLGLRALARRDVPAVRRRGGALGDAVRAHAGRPRADLRPRDPRLPLLDVGLRRRRHQRARRLCVPPLWLADLLRRLAPPPLPRRLPAAAVAAGGDRVVHLRLPPLHRRHRPRHHLLPRARHRVRAGRHVLHHRRRRARPLPLPPLLARLHATKHSLRQLLPALLHARDGALALHCARVRRGARAADAGEHGDLHLPARPLVVHPTWPSAVRPLLRVRRRLPRRPPRHHRPRRLQQGAGQRVRPARGHQADARGGQDSGQERMAHHTRRRGGRGGRSAAAHCEARAQRGRGGGAPLLRGGRRAHARR